MALHKTQCPHCFTDYVISDEQYRASEGMVRCGTCRERFQARLNSDETAIPKFDSKEMYIEPISQDAESNEHLIEEQPTPISFGEIKRLKDSATFSMHSELSLGFSENEYDEPSSSDNISTDDILANIQAREKRRQNNNPPALGEPQNTGLSSEINAQTDSSESIQNNQDQQLINQVDELIEDKLISNNATTNNTIEALNEVVDTISDQPVASLQDSIREDSLDAPVAENSVLEDEVEAEEVFTLKPKKAKRGFLTWLLTPLLGAMCLALIAALIYQLWFRQVMFFDPGSKGDRVVTSVASEFNKQIAKKNMALPIRRDLSLLELVSARTKPHPTRSSTTLLEVGLINHAKIAQAMPWLELALYTKQGKLVSRRNLSPNDYSYNNDTTLMMTPREYRRLSIELLSFPKNATGYELKLLNR